MGEEDFSFETYLGNIKFDTTNEVLSPFGGLVPFAAFLKKTKVLEDLAADCPVVRSSPNAAPVYDILCSLALTTICDGTRFEHVNRLRYDPMIPKLFNLKRVVGDDAIRRLLRSIDAEKGRSWFAKNTQRIWSSLPDGFILDWDSTVMTKYGDQEGAEIGYNPTKKGRPSYHPLLAFVGGTRLCPYYRCRPGNTASASEWIEAMEECLNWLGPNKRPALNRGDISFGVDKIMKWHEDKPNAPQYLFKLKITRKTAYVANALDESVWQGESTNGALQVADVEIQLSTWEKPRRVVLGRRLFKKQSAEEANLLYDYIDYKYEAYVTNLTKDQANAWQIVDLYNQRADCENILDEVKNQWGFDGFCCKKLNATEHAARINLLMYNLWNLFCRFMDPDKHIEAGSGRRWHILIASKLVETAREKTLKMSVSNAWQKMLTEGYKNLCNWIKSTAPQLDHLIKNITQQNKLLLL